MTAITRIDMAIVTTWMGARLWLYLALVGLMGGWLMRITKDRGGKR